LGKKELLGNSNSDKGRRLCRCPSPFTKHKKVAHVCPVLKWASGMDGRVKRAYKGGVRAWGSEMKTSNHLTVVYGALSVALLAVLLLRPNIFNYWQTGVLFAGVAILALLAFRNVGR